MPQPVRISHRRITHHTFHAKNTDDIAFVADEPCTVIFNSGKQVHLDGQHQSVTKPPQPGHNAYEVDYPDGAVAVPTGDIMVP